METKGRKKLFISGPVTGVPYYWREFEKAQGFYEEMGYAVMIPSELPVGMSNADYARICLSMIDSADEVAFLPGWRDSIGCKLEHDYCYYIRKPVRLFTDDAENKTGKPQKQKFFCTLGVYGRCVAKAQVMEGGRCMCSTGCRACKWCKPAEEAPTDEIEEPEARTTIDLTKIFDKLMEANHDATDAFEDIMDAAVGQALENGYSIDFSSDAKGWRNISLLAPQHRVDDASDHLIKFNADRVQPDRLVHRCRLPDDEDCPYVAFGNGTGKCCIRPCPECVYFSIIEI